MLLSLYLGFLFMLQVATPVSAFLQIGVARTVSLCTALHHDRRALGLDAAARQGMGYEGESGDPNTLTTNPERPVVVFGGGGKTGRIITQILADQKHHVRAVTRTKEKKKLLESAVPNPASPYLSYAVADVTIYDDVLSVLQQGAAGVIWAATCSGKKKGGGDAAEVDFMGAFHAAKACLACCVPKLAFISAGCVTRPNSLGSKAVNFLTHWTYGDTPWVDAKVAGETAVRDLYRASSNKKSNENTAYVIIRPAAALSDKAPNPVKELLVMQGDVYSSAETISRTNVANLVISALFKGKATDFVTFEVAPAAHLYKNDEGNLFDLLNLPTRHQTAIPDLPKSLVHANALTYSELLDGLVTDEDMQNQYSSIVSDYRGEGVPSVQEFA